jgi:hypothetical protein
MNMRSIRNRINPPPCQSDEWCPQCTFAIHCHEQRMGIRNRIFWPGIALVLLALLALPALLF